MRDNVLARKKAGIILLLAKTLKVSPETSLGLFYSTNTNSMLSDKRYGTQLMSNQSLVRDIVAELRAIGRPLGGSNPQTLFCGGIAKQAESCEAKPTR